ncbi:hypothetical protein ACGFSD_28070 [Streptomyces caniferus]|uniref:hypothetical protein n=1 Tax=Streptomyces caniferus TaxID=285557 RepID=UPI00371D15E4
MSGPRRCLRAAPAPPGVVADDDRGSGPGRDSGPLLRVGPLLQAAAVRQGDGHDVAGAVGKTLGIAPTEPTGLVRARVALAVRRLLDD